MATQPAVMTEVIIGVVIQITMATRPGETTTATPCVVTPTAMAIRLVATDNRLANRRGINSPLLSMLLNNADQKRPENHAEILRVYQKLIF